ncbi:MAG: aldo/keto reductase [Cyanophyceae cyanobacterium]
MVPPTLQTVRLGPTTLEVPALGIGTWSWGDKLYWDYGNTYDREQLHASFAAATEAGLVLFDTAEIYGLGESERLLGDFMKGSPYPVCVASKYFPFPWRIFPQQVVDALDATLERLGRSQVDLYQIHWPLHFLLGHKTLLKTLADQVKAGKIRAIGVSNYSAAQLREAHGYLKEWGVPLAVNQVQYSLLERRIERNGVLAAARELDVAILAYCPLAQGLLTGKYGRETSLPPTGARRLDPRFTATGFAKILPVVDALREIGDRRDRTAAQVALNWLITRAQVVPIPGAKTPEQVRENVGALGWSLSPEEGDLLATLTQEF